MNAKPPIAGRAAPTATGLSARPRLARSLYFPTGPQLQAFAAFRIRPPRATPDQRLSGLGQAPPKLWEITGGEDFIIHEAVPTPTPSTHFVIDRLTNRAEVAEV